MLKKVIVSVIILLIVNELYSQSKRANNWLFSNFAGITFNSTPPVAVTNGAMGGFNIYGAASISDTSGNLLFYTDGEHIWNKLHQRMPNDLLIQAYDHIPIIVPKPNNKDIYYIITSNYTALNPSLEGISYSIIDISLNNGLGGIVQKNLPIVLCNAIGPLLTATSHSNGIDYWLVGTGYSENIGYKLYIIKITNQGITIHNQISFDFVDMVVFSPNGNKIGLYRYGSKLTIYSFNTTTGELNYPIDYPYIADFYYFSQDGTKIYGDIAVNVNELGLCQYDLLTNQTTILKSGYDWAFTFQLTPDGRIFFGKFNGSYVGAINYPNLAGLACSVQDSIISLQNKTISGLFPMFVSNYLFHIDFMVVNNCTLQPINFLLNSINNIQSALWNFGDGQTSTLLSPTHIYANAGAYAITLTVTFTNSTTQTVNKQVTINPKPINLIIIHK